MSVEPESSGLSRRGLLRTGGLTVSLAALLAACGGEEGAPGRVGNTPVATPLPTVEVDDAVLLRTASSLAYTANELYTKMIADDVLAPEAVALLERFMSDHDDAAKTLAGLTEQAGGQPWTCANEWTTSRVLAPVFERIDGGGDVEETDDRARDYLGLAYAFESMIGAAHQQILEQLTVPDVRVQIATLGARAARHSAAVALLRTGSPEGYVSPTLYGEEVDPTQTDGVPPLFAVTDSFGSVAPVQLYIGAPTAGGRFSTSIDTPADNSYVYNELTCEA